MKIADELQFRLLDLDGLKTLVNWAAQEGWNPGPRDAEVFFATDPEGFYGYFDHDEMIAGGSIVSYQKAFGFMGFFIVKPEYRSSGIGHKLWYQRRDTLLSRLNPGAAIGMDGVVAMQPFYKKGGFEIAFRDERHEKTGTAFVIEDHITPITDEDFEAIMVYDLQCFGFERSRFMKSWLKLPESKTFKFIENGRHKGFAVMRKANKGYKICPLFADDAAVATELYKACLNAVPGEPVYLDIPVVNQAAVELTKAFNTTYVFECARMYYGKPPDIPIDKVFGITTFELG